MAGAQGAAAMNMDRREFVLAAGALAARGAWGQPGFPSVRNFGAVGDGVTKGTAAIQRAIDRAAADKAGCLSVPPGTYLTGALELRSGLTLCLERGAVLKGSADLADYKVSKVRWEGKWIDGYGGLLSARDCHNVGIVGPGRIEGAVELGGRPTKDQPLRHPALIEPIGCTGVLFEGFSTSYARMWSLHPTYCEDVTIKGLTIRSTGGNGDGIDVDSCRRVKIDGCDIATGDDCISVKSGRGMEGFTLARPSEDIEITNCTFADSIFACIGIGSETSGGIRNVRVSKCRFTGAKTFAFYIKSRPGRGAFIEDIAVSDCDVTGEYGGGFLRFNMTGSGLQDENPVTGPDAIPKLARWSFKDIRVGDVPVMVDGAAMTPERPLDGLVLEGISGSCAMGFELSHVRNAVLRNNKVACRGELLSLVDVTGQGLEGKVKK